MVIEGPYFSHMGSWGVTGDYDGLYGGHIGSWGLLGYLSINDVTLGGEGEKPLKRWHLVTWGGVQKGPKKVMSFMNSPLSWGNTN